MMTKKILFSVLIVLMASLPFGTSAYAEGDDPGEGAGVHRHIGQVTAIGDDQFSIALPNGSEATILVDDDTAFKSREGEASFDDLSVGQWVAGSAARDGEGNLLAKVVILLPEDFEPGNIPGRKLRGTISDVDVGSNTFGLETESGENLRISVNEETRYLGRVESFDDLEAGMQAVVVAKEGEDGSLLALAVAAGGGERPEGKRFAGKVESVGDNSFTIAAAGGDPLNLLVDDETVFRSRSGEINDLEDLEAGMVVGGMAVIQEDGSLLAKVVLAGQPDDIAGKGAIGVVSSVGSSSFSMTTRAGETLNLVVTEETRFVSRSGEVEGLDDLEVGMHVGVKYEESSDGRLLAKAVAVGGEGERGERPDGPAGGPPEGRPFDLPLGGLDEG